MALPYGQHDRALSTRALVIHISIIHSGVTGELRCNVKRVNPELQSLLYVGDGLVTWRQAARVVPGWVVEYAYQCGQLRRMLPGVYQDSAAPETPELWRRAALAWLDGRGALSHTTALAVWGLHEPVAGEPVRVTVPREVRLRPQPAVVVHGRAGFAPDPPQAVVRRGLLVTPLERSLVDAWPLLPAAGRRAPVIRAVNDWMTTPARIAAVVARHPRLPRHAELCRLLGLLEAGCRSPLEIWGHEHVFTGPGMPELQRQVRLKVGSRSFYLDLYAPYERVNFELDGASVHGDPRQREIDLRRDALLATRGVQVVRLSHRRLVHETCAVRRESLAILARRRLVS